MVTQKRIDFVFDERSLLTREQLRSQGGLSRIAPAMTCDCCGAGELLGGCVRGLLPCTCDKVPAVRDARFREHLLFWCGVRCRACQRCPAHCRCQATHE